MGIRPRQAFKVWNAAVEWPKVVSRWPGCGCSERHDGQRVMIVLRDAFDVDTGLHQSLATRATCSKSKRLDYGYGKTVTSLGRAPIIAALLSTHGPPRLPPVSSIRN